MGGHRTRAIVIVFTLIIIVIAAVIWFAPFGTGEYLDSPDGRYRANASNIRRGTWANGRISLVHITVRDNGNGNLIWSIERFPQPAESVATYGDRQMKHLNWSPDSSAVSITVGPDELTLPVP